MYGRYTDTGGRNMPVAERKKSMVKNIIIIFLVLVIGALCAVGVPALQAQRGSHQVYVQMIQSECEEAVKLTTSLSRNAGSDSAAILARIRSHIYAMRTINGVSIAQDGAAGRLVSEELFDGLLTMLDSYLAFLTTGMDTGEYQSNLQTSLDALQSELRGLK